MLGGQEIFGPKFWPIHQVQAGANLCGNDGIKNRSRETAMDLIH